MKAIIYLRVSSIKQTNDGAGLSSQEQSCREYATRSGYEVVETYSDVISGRVPDRPGMNKLMTHLKRVDGKDYVVVVDDLSRFARDVSVHTALRDRILSCGARIESPKQKFTNDAGGRFMEILFAAIAAHDREKNAEQSKSRTIARLKNGFWTFSCPVGYRYEKAPSGGKMLVRNEPLAAIVTEALEGFACGRFQTQAEVQRFLNSKHEFPRQKSIGSVKFDTVTGILTRLVYAGYIKYDPWDVPLTQAQHEPLISYDTYQIIQARLAERSVAPVRRDIHRDFPLRGFLVCGACGYRLTSCWSRSRTGKKYPYYFCHHKGCSESRKSIPRDAIENEFKKLLQKTQPSRMTYELARQMFERAWDRKVVEVEAETQRLQTMRRQTAKNADALVERVLRTASASTQSLYERKLEDLQSELALLDAAISKSVVPPKNFEQMFELAMDFFASPYKTWINSGITIKRAILPLVFSEPIKVTRFSGVRTGETTLPFKVLQFLQDSEFKVVPPHGLEPRTY